MCRPLSKEVREYSQKSGLAILFGLVEGCSARLISRVISR